MFTLEQVVPWGRSFAEYRSMFALTDADIGTRILGCGDGPASFNAEATTRGATVTSADPIYQWDEEQILARITATCDDMLEQTRRNQDDFVWDSIGSVDELGRVRMQAMRNFLSDFARGKTDGRYVCAALPSLPFDALSFDLALCSHFLFLYSAQLGEAFHAAALEELCRVAHEVRVFPLLALGGQPSPHVMSCTERLRASGFEVSVERVPYEFQRGGNEMMRIRRESR